MFGDGAEIGAAVVDNQHAGRACRIEVDTVVAGAEQLHEAKPRGATIEGAIHAFDVAEQVFGGGKRFAIGGVGGGSRNQREIWRRHLVCELHGFGGFVDEQ
jgi:hypothetical protein